MTQFVTSLLHCCVKCPSCRGCTLGCIIVKNLGPIIVVCLQLNPNCSNNSSASRLVSTTASADTAVKTWGMLWYDRHTANVHRGSRIIHPRRIARALLLVPRKRRRTLSSRLSALSSQLSALSSQLSAFSSLLAALSSHITEHYYRASYTKHQEPRTVSRQCIGSQAHSFAPQRTNVTQTHKRHTRPFI